jgi:outer membrane protein assembly factor BamB
MKHFLPTALLLLAALPVSGDDWLEWRGPRRDGISTETGWLDRWPEGGPKVAWKAQVGIGFSAFTVGGGRAFTMGNADNVQTLFAFDAATGAKLWAHSWPSELGDKFYEGGPGSSVTIEGERLYVQAHWGDVLCLEAGTGKVIWITKAQAETGADTPDWGFNGSPVIHGNLLLLNMGEAGAALDKATGKIAWKSAPKKAGYSTLLPMKIGGKELALLGSERAYIAVDPKTGLEAWRIPWRTEYGVNSADPVLHGDQLFLTSGYGFGCGLFKVGDGAPKEIWKAKTLRAHMHPPVLAGGHVYGMDGQSNSKSALICVDLATSKATWTFPTQDVGAVTAADGKLILISGEGELVVGPMSPDGFKPSARAKILGGRCWTVPVLANGRIYVRNAAGDAVCLDVRKP